MAVVLGLLAAISYGTADFLGGLGSKRNPMVRVVLVSQVVGATVYVAALPLLPEGNFTRAAWLWGGLSGLAGAVGVGFLYRGLARGRMSVVAPVTAVIAAVMPVAFGLATGERPSVLQLVGVAVALPAVALVSRGPEPAGTPSAAGSGVVVTASRAGLVDAVVSGIGIGLFFIVISRAGENSGPWPLVANRVVSITVFAVAALATRTSVRPAPGSVSLVAGAGVLDVTANLLYLLGTRAGLLSIVAVLTSLYPGATVVLARMVLGERLAAAQLVGLALALLGVAAMGAG
jgi:uncharacterized membrane protein